jgi:hypothetical protein
MPVSVSVSVSPAVPSVGSSPVVVNDVDDVVELVVVVVNEALLVDAESPVGSLVPSVWAVESPELAPS